MEDALAQQLLITLVKLYSCLNPCFNGRCTRTIHNKKIHDNEKIVLILVLMEDALAHYNNGTTYLNYSVLILVLMEDALAHELFEGVDEKKKKS